ncbi:beta-lactamase family protein [Streptomyces lonarensis]|uniref:Beta-lactamase family protein n=1 Tax=Streptomyces lonarensis TaxID=700599 RepID=A0A7X6HYH8_9ACTN|nr:beta-lactamase family protein [Streptomyces lonarensis]
MTEGRGGPAAGIGRGNGRGNGAAAADDADAGGGRRREIGSDGLGGRQIGQYPAAGRAPGTGRSDGRPAGSGTRTLAAPADVDAPADGWAPTAGRRLAEPGQVRGSGRDAVGHGRDGRTPVPPLLMGGFAPAGSVRATPHDLLAFLEAQLEPETTPLENELRALRGPVLRRGFGHRHTHTVSWFHRPGERGAVLFHAGATSGQQALLAFRPATGTAMVALSTRRFRASDPFPRVVHGLIDQLP